MTRLATVADELEFSLLSDHIRELVDRLYGVDQQQAEENCTNSYDDGYEQGYSDCEDEGRREADNEYETGYEEGLAAGDAWKKMIMRFGETLDNHGPNAYYTMTPDEWYRWAISTKNDIS